jgi:rhodanese-related sulfurtransferase
MSDITRISPAEAFAKMKEESAPYVDVRTEEEFDAGHPAGAFNVPLSTSTAAGMVPNHEFVAVMVRAFPKDAPLILGCRTGVRSARAAKALAEAGFTKLFDQRAGWDGAKGPFGELAEPGWSRTDLPQETGAPSGQSYAAMRAK